jgi:hypothetical protein
LVIAARLGSLAGRWPSLQAAGALPLPVAAAGPVHSSDMLLLLNRPSTGLLALGTVLRPSASVT